MFLGSSFAFIAALCVVLDPAGAPNSFGMNRVEQIQVAMWGVMGAGAIYLVFALLIKLIGMRFIDRLFRLWCGAWALPSSD